MNTLFFSDRPIQPATRAALERLPLRPRNIARAERRAVAALRLLLEAFRRWRAEL